MTKFLFPLAAIALMSACSEGPDLAAANAKLSQCAAQAGIAGSYAVEIKVVGNEAMQRIKPEQGVTEAQASKANACLAA